uniref:Uncharacterized protein n=1 Tax=Anguilla anguilla TaxID=7936 RepID=A0A0E9PFX2_ANGAN
MFANNYVGELNLSGKPGS